jgi:hypothetical protein
LRTFFGDLAGVALSLHHLVFAVVPAFAVLGFYRLWLGIVEKWPDCFYAANSGLLDDKYRHVEPVYRTHASLTSFVG